MAGLLNLPLMLTALDLSNISWLFTEVKEELYTKCKQRVKTSGFWVMLHPP